MSEPKIYAALAKVMADVGAIGKTRKNEAQKYQFRGVDDVVAHVQDVMTAHGVVCVPRVVERERELLDSRSGGKMASVRLLVEHTFYASDGSHVVCTTLGEAMDSGDKASNKAMSAALKYALTETLLIPTYEVDRDTEEQSPQLAQRPPAAGQMATAPKTPPSNVRPLNDATLPWEAKINEAQTVEQLAVVASAIAKESDAVKKAVRELWNRRHAALAAQEKRAENAQPRGVK